MVRFYGCCIKFGILLNLFYSSAALKVEKQPEKEAEIFLGKAERQADLVQIKAKPEEVLNEKSKN